MEQATKSFMGQSWIITLQAARSYLSQALLDQHTCQPNSFTPAGPLFAQIEVALRGSNSQSQLPCFQKVRLYNWENYSRKVSLLGAALQLYYRQTSSGFSEDFHSKVSS